MRGLRGQIRDENGPLVVTVSGYPCGDDSVSEAAPAVAIAEASRTESGPCVQFWYWPGLDEAAASEAATQAHPIAARRALGPVQRVRS